MRFGGADLRGELVDEHLVRAGGGHQEPMVVRREHSTVGALLKGQFADGDTVVDGIDLPNRRLARAVVVAGEKFAVVIGHQISGAQVHSGLMGELQFAVRRNCQRGNRRGFFLGYIRTGGGVHQLTVRRESERAGTGERDLLQRRQFAGGFIYGKHTELAAGGEVEALLGVARIAIARGRIRIGLGF